MKKVIAYIAISVDGYIADATGSVSWLGGDGSDNQNFFSVQLLFWLFSPCIIFFILLN